MAAERIEIYQREDKLYDWRIVAGNNEIVATSGGQGFRDRTDAHRAIEFLEEDLPVVQIVNLDYGDIDLGNGDDGLGPVDEGLHEDA